MSVMGTPTSTSEHDVTLLTIYDDAMTEVFVHLWARWALQGCVISSADALRWLGPSTRASTAWRRRRRE